MPFRGSSTVSDTDTTATDGGDSPHQTYRGEKVKHRRTSRACDQCRKTKSRCDHSGNSSMPCRSCLLSGYDCTFFEPSQKRGPPKGYLSALESRLHEAEALLGVIISSNDMRAKTLVFDLAKDSLANTIIKRVTHSVFGPIGRETLRVRGSGGSCGESQTSPPNYRRPTDSRRQQMNSREVAMMGDDGNLVFTTPSNTWQDYLSNRLATEATYPFSSVPTSVTRIEIPEHSSFHLMENADGHRELSASKADSEVHIHSEDDIPSRHSSFSSHTNDGNMESTLSGIPSTHWSPTDPVFGEQDQNHFPNALCLEGTYSYGRRPISEAFSKDTNEAQNFMTSEAHTIPRNPTSTTQTAGWAGMLSHENHHSSRLFAQESFVNPGLDLNTIE